VTDDTDLGDALSMAAEELGRIGMMSYSTGATWAMPQR